MYLACTRDFKWCEPVAKKLGDAKSEYTLHTIQNVAGCMLGTILTMQASKAI